MSGAAGHAIAEEIVVIVNPDCDVSALDRQLVEQIFTGKSNVLRPYDQSESSPAREQFYKNITNRSAAQVKAMWSRLVFGGRGQFPEELLNSKAVRRTIASDPKGIGYIEKSAVDETVKVIMTLE
jgi:ABC-type phosphate transport system substrate-binding protein